MFVDANSIASGTQLEFDVCVIGAGAAGIAIARSLMGGATRVALLESGGREPEAGSQALNLGENNGIPYFSLIAARLRMFGGTTNHWGGVAHPFQARDFEKREWIPMTGWPISKADLDPYYEAAAEICGVEAPERLESGVSDTPASEFGERFVRRTLQRVPRAKRRLAPRYEEEFERSKNVEVLLHANVMELVADRDVRRVRTVRVATLEGNALTVAARCFVLATGGIENPRILLASTAQRPAGLGNDHDLVGRCFLEHPRYVAGVLAPADPWLAVQRYRWHADGGATICDYLELAPELKRDEAVHDVQVRIEPIFTGELRTVSHANPVEAARALAKALKRGAIADDFGAHVRTVAHDLTRWQEHTLPGAPIPVPKPELLQSLLRASPQEASSLLHAALGDLAGMGMVTTGFAALERIDLTTILQPAPNAQSRVTLGEQRDALGMRRPVLDWRLGQDDRRSIRRTLELFAAAAGQAGIGRVQILHEIDDNDWPPEVRGGWHHIGTTRMSDDPREGVVDRDCRVHGLANLYVAGSSVFPTAGSGSPTLTLVALALRLADHLKREELA